VVIADDDLDTRKLLTAALHRDGRFTVVGVAADGDAAVAAAERLQPDLVLLDLAMPVRGGLDALPMVREVAPRARVVVVSGFPGDRLEAVTRASGAVGYVEKSLSPKQTVRDVLAVAGVLDAIDVILSSSQTFDQDLASGRAARRFMEEILGEWHCDELLDNVNLLVTELVTNAVVHASSDAEVAVVLLPKVLRVEVADRGEGMPAAKHADDMATSGRGIALVDTLSSRWGTDRRPDGRKVTWFEVERPGF
jgi:DNA-binding NarL/FixJ family response regulator